MNQLAKIARMRLGCKGQSPGDGSYLEAKVSSEVFTEEEGDEELLPLS